MKWGRKICRLSEGRGVWAEETAERPLDKSIPAAIKKKKSFNQRDREGKRKSVVTVLGATYSSFKCINLAIYRVTWKAASFEWQEKILQQVQAGRNVPGYP